MIAVIADIHSNVKRYKKLIEYFEQEQEHTLGENDVVFVLGDLLGMQKERARTEKDKKKYDKELLDYLAEQPYRVISISGNHDSARILYKRGYSRPGHEFGGDVLYVGENITYLLNGGTYDIPDGEGNTVRILALGGAFGHMYRFHKKPYAPAATYLMQSYINLMYRHGKDKIKVDYVMSHEGPSSKMTWFIKNIFGLNPFNDIMEKIDDNVKRDFWYFGHHHADFDPDGDYICIYKRALKLPSSEDIT